ncbi:hypothetical protein AC1031_017664 [Aphanomyces cochlioides]|nr:hypothetical protein AC1031_017664 [Aphanomyces cochlioides]
MLLDNKGAISKMAGTRLAILASVLVPILLIAPYAYKLLLVPRSPLPFEAIHVLDLAASTEHLRASLRATETLAILQGKHHASIEFAILPKIKKIQVSSKDISVQDGSNDDAEIDRALYKQLQDLKLADQAVFVLLCRDNADGDASAIKLGAYRHAWTFACRVSTEQQQILLDTLFPSFDASDIKPALKYRWSFSILNEVPHNASLAEAWSNVLDSAMSWIEPFAHTLSTTLADVTLESQLVHYAKLAKTYRQDAQGNQYVTPDDLQQFKSANDFSTSSVLEDREQIFHFMGAIPRSPSLHIRYKGAAAYSFLIPSYGGVTIVPTPQDVPRMMQVFVHHCRLLLGLSLPSSNSVAIIPSKKNGLASWEVDILMRRWLVRHWHATLQTLQSIATLVENMPQMIVLERIQSQVTKALKLVQSVDLNEMESPTSRQTHLATLRQARLAVEDAYYDPTMVSQLYFPEEQIYAVYLPLLLPLLLPLGGGLVREIKRYRRKKKVD